MHNFLQDILKESNTIIIPGLGALTITSAKTGDIYFMPFLKHDDGHLAKYVATHEGIELLEAKEILSNFVNAIKLAISEDDYFEMEGFGRFFKNKEGEIDFQRWEDYQVKDTSILSKKVKERQQAQPTKIISPVVEFKKEEIKSDEAVKSDEEIHQQIEEELPISTNPLHVTLEETIIHPISEEPESHSPIIEQKSIDEILGTTEQESDVPDSEINNLITLIEEEKESTDSNIITSDKQPDIIPETIDSSEKEIKQENEHVVDTKSTKADSKELRKKLKSDAAALKAEEKRLKQALKLEAKQLAQKAPKEKKKSRSILLWLLSAVIITGGIMWYIKTKRDSEIQLTIIDKKESKVVTSKIIEKEELRNEIAKHRSKEISTESRSNTSETESKHVKTEKLNIPKKEEVKKIKVAKVDEVKKEKTSNIKPKTSTVKPINTQKPSVSSSNKPSSITPKKEVTTATVKPTKTNENTAISTTTKIASTSPSKPTSATTNTASATTSKPATTSPVKPASSTTNTASATTTKPATASTVKPASATTNTASATTTKPATVSTVKPASANTNTASATTTKPATASPVKPTSATTNTASATTTKPATASPAKPTSSTTNTASATTTKPATPSPVKPASSTTNTASATTTKPATTSAVKPVNSTTNTASATTTKPATASTLKPASANTNTASTTTSKPAITSPVKPASATTNTASSTTTKPATPSPAKPINGTTDFKSSNTSNTTGYVSTNKNIQVVVGTFKDKAAADQFVTELKGKGFGNAYSKVDNGKFSVSLGSFSTLSESNQALQKYKSGK